MDPPDTPDPCEPFDRPAPCPARGIFEAPVSIELRAPDPNAAIHYTLDGSEPSPASPVYDGDPIELAADPASGGVRVLRAIAIGSDGASPVATHSYIFPAAVLEQPAAPPGLPAVWGAGDSTREGDYEMDAAALEGARDEAEAALAAIPSVSIVADPADLWGPSGIYMNPEESGDAWERPMSIEWIDPAGAGFHIRGGVRIQGGSSTQQWKSAKLSLRVAFRAAYGAGKLRYRLFPDSPAAAFENLILDAHLNHTWLHPDEAQRSRAQYARDSYTAALQNRVGSLAPHGRPVHLYLNGLYWGLYDLHERPDAHFAAAHLGGSDDEWDVIRHGPGNVVDGSGESYDELLALVEADLSADAAYEAVAALIDTDDLINYMLVNFYVGNDDWDHHNWYAAARRGAGTGFRFFSWDAEHVLKDVAQDSTAIDNAGGPSRIFARLLANDGFRARVQARADELYAAELAGTAPADLYLELTGAIEGPILLEAARWGDNRQPDDPHTRSDWYEERRWLLDDYFPGRAAIARDQI